MIQSQQEPCGQRQHILRQARNPLLQRHPILLPFVLLCGAIVLVISSFFADSLFPVLVLIRAPSALVCLLLAFVLGTCGILTSIIGCIENVERYCLQTAIYLRSKEQSYDRN